MKTYQIDPKSLKDIRMLADEIDRHRLTMVALHDRLIKEIFVATGVDTNNEDCELDLASFEGMLLCKEK